MKEITFVIGLPGSGKSFMMKNSNYKTYDDWGIWTLDDKREEIGGLEFDTECRYDELIKDTENNIAIISIGFCNTEFLNRSENILKSKLADVKINRIYFENNLEKCIQNIKYRDRKRGGYWEYNEEGSLWYIGDIFDDEPLFEKEIRKATELSKDYIIPENYKPIKITTK